MPLERRPLSPLPASYRPASGVAYQVKDGDSWISVAARNGLDAKSLIVFNFLTRDPQEVNWYLREFVGCKKTSPDGKNWAFSADASPGIIYLPPGKKNAPKTSSIPAPPSPNKPPPAGYGPAGASASSPELMVKVREALAQPIGTQLQVSVKGMDYILALEWHYNAPQSGQKPLGWHKGVTVYQRKS